MDFCGQASARTAYGLVDAFLLTCPGAVLMRSDDGGVDHGVLVVGIIHHRFEKTLPNPFDRPARETGVNVLPGPEPLWHVAPRNACPEFPDHSFDEEFTAEFYVAPKVSRTPWQHFFHPCVLVVAQSMAVHREAS